VVSPGFAPRARRALPEQLLTVAQVADALGVCRATIYKLCERGELAHVRVSNAIRFEYRHLEAFIAVRTGRNSVISPPRAGADEEVAE